MKTLFVSLALCLPLGSTAVAQDDAMRPPAALDAFEPMLGTWEGSGGFVMEAGGASEPWKGVYTAKRILNGHAVQEDLRVDMPMGVLVMRTVFAFDAERGEIVCHEFSNMGSTTSTAKWLDKNRLQSVGHGIDDHGQLYVRRWTQTFRGDASTFVLDTGIDDKPFFTHVDGEWKRGGDAFTADSAKAAGVLPVGKAEMARLAGLLGEHDFTGTVTMNPGDPAMAISGHESITWLFEGSVLVNHVVGQPSGYEAYGYLFWDPRAKCYSQVGFNTMGIHGSMQARWADESLVFSSAGPWMGKPGASVLVLELDEKGAPTRSVSTRIAGTSDPYVAFEGTYVRAGAAGAAKTPAFSAGSCCAKAVAAGSACTHPCCVQATAGGTVCTKCNK